MTEQRNPNKDYETHSSKLAELVDARRRLVAQEHENIAVKEEFDKLKDHNTVYKLVGPGLVKQDQQEARSNVDKRLEFIRAELKRVDGQVSEAEGSLESIKAEIMQRQSQAQSQAEGQRSQQISS